MKIIIKYLIYVSIMVFFISCNLSDIQSKEECLDDFFSKAVSGSWNSMYKEIHKDNPQRDQYKSGTIYFEPLYGLGSPVTYSIASKSGDTFYVNVDPDGSGSEVEKFVFKVEEETMFGDDTWLIRSFTSDGQTSSH